MMRLATGRLEGSKTLEGMPFKRVNIASECVNDRCSFGEDLDVFTRLSESESTFFPGKKKSGGKANKKEKPIQFHKTLPHTIFLFERFFYKKN